MAVQPLRSQGGRGWRRSQRPAGQPTRGKTAANRLRSVDRFLLLYDAPLIRRQDAPGGRAWFVDLGYGAEPVTTLESAMRLRRCNPTLSVLGVEIDPVRVANAQRYVDAHTDFRLGGFNLPLKQLSDDHAEMVRAIRAFNVLRQYEEAAVAPAYAEMAYAALPGALLVEGTSDPMGHLWVANVMRRAQNAPLWHQEVLVFYTALRTPFAPEAFQAVLPKNLIHHMLPGEPIYTLIAAWQEAKRCTIHERIWGDRRWFMAAGRALRRAGFAVDPRRRWLGRGYLLVRSMENRRDAG
jgi:hypothetical protein